MANISKYLLKLSLIIKTVFILIFFISISGCRPSRIYLDPLSKDFIEKAQLIMSKEEKEIFNHLPDAETRKEFINDFWEKRDPDPSTEKNEFREEFYRRIEFADRHFMEGIPGWKTDRGRVYILLGPPDKVEEFPFLDRPGARSYIIWVYYDLKVAVEFIDREGDRRYSMIPVRAGLSEFMEAIDRAKFGGVLKKEEGFERKYLDFDADVKGGEICIFIPTNSLILKEEDEFLKGDYQFNFYIYDKNGRKIEQFNDVRELKIRKEEILKLKKVEFKFSHQIEKGVYYFDITIIEIGSKSKTRKIFKIKI